MIRRSAIATALLVASFALSGCVATPPPTVSVPTGETVAADLAGFYSQELQWSSCEGTFQCATATAPLDWSDPSRASIDLALIRSNATGDRLGSLLVNPGGPGGSGYNFVRDGLDTAVSAPVRERYDTVGFDPRGVNKSSAVSCYDDPAQLDSFLFGIPQSVSGTDAYIAELAASSKEFGAACLEHTGDLLGFVDTVSAARDLDLLRSILGDAKLNYLGYSYGTLLGATYADLYPGKTGRLVLDGAVDPATSEFDVTSTQAKGFESALRAYLKDCETGSTCPFAGTVDQAMLDIRSLLDSLETSPLRATDGRQLGSSAMFTAIILPLYSASNWPYLGDLFTSVMAGDADYAFQLADSYYSRTAEGTYNDNSTEAFVAINCLDYRSTDTVETLKAQAAELAAMAPVFGPSMSYGGSGCADWPFTSTRDRVAISAPGSAPILVVGTTNDPATPYVWAQNLAGELESGHLLTYNGEGHTAYNKSNACVNDTVDAFLIDGTVPATDPDC
ncbi:MAG: alpha/beta fold hydrolase [Burkholderiaceae bacterium]|nr:alpha/beta fold hydrolase [Microbacteriaceae bacterium]